MAGIPGTSGSNALTEQGSASSGSGAPQGASASARSGISSGVTTSIGPGVPKEPGESANTPSQNGPGVADGRATSWGVVSTSSGTLLKRFFHETMDSGRLSSACKSSKLATAHAKLEAFIDVVDGADTAKEFLDAQRRLRKTFKSTDSPRAYRAEADKVCEALIKKFSDRVKRLYNELP